MTDPLPTDYQGDPSATPTPDPATMTGAQFKSHACADPAKWAEAFVRACDCHDYAQAMLRDERIAYATRWFSDAMGAAVAHAQASHQKIIAELAPRPDVPAADA